MKGFNRYVSSLALAVSCLASSAAFAQAANQNEAAEGNPAGDIGDIGDIIVTANRTESLASKTPVTLTAVTGNELKSLGVTSSSQLASVVPNVSIDRGNGNGLQITIRGVSSTDNTQKGDPSAAFLLDGVYIPFQNATEVALYDLERVEVLRGPQGTLYGRNTTAGVVNVISAAPTFNLSGSADAEFASYNLRHLTGVINVPLSDTLAVRVAANYVYRDSFIRQAVAQPFSVAPDQDTISVRGSILFKPSSSVKLLVRGDYNRMHGSGSSFGSLVKISNFYQVPLAAPASSAVRTADPVFLHPSAYNALAKTWSDVAPFNARNNTWGVSGQLDVALTDSLTATWLGSYREFNRDETGANYFGADYTTTPPTDVVPNTFNKSAYNVHSEELRLAYNSDDLKIQIGAYYFKYKWDFEVGFFNFGLPAVGSSESKAVFGQATYSLTDALHITAGVRYTDDSKEQTSGFRFPPNPPLGTNTAEANSQKTTWKATLDYQIDPATLAYATIATGYKAGGFNGNCNTPDFGCIYKPETVTDYEAGIKTRLFDNMLRLNASAFHYDYKNRQLSQVVTDPSNNLPTVKTTNAASAKIDGAELEANFLPTPDDRFDLSVAWLHSRYTDYVLQPGNPASANFNGAPLDYSPKWNLTGGYMHTISLGDSGKLTAAVRSTYSSGYVMLSTIVNALFRQPSYTKTDLSLTYASPNDRWTVQAYVHNLENSVPVTYIDMAVGFPNLNDGKASFGDPRTYGVRMGVTF